MRRIDDADSSVADTELGLKERELALLVRDWLTKGNMPALPERFENDETVREIYDYISTIRQGLVALARGDLTFSVGLKGYTSGTIKALQSNLRHLMWKALSVAKGDFSQQIDFMGNVEEAFNSMVEQLRDAHDRLFAVSEALRQEVDARKAVEAELLQEKERLQQLATTDTLTSLFNRRYFWELALREVERMRRNGLSSCIAMLDLDNFKHINDGFGHGRGDQELRALASIIKNNTRLYDIPARYGGDEFIIFFPDATPERAYAIMERIRLRLYESNAGRSKTEPKVTISGGIAALRLAHNPAAEVLDEAVSRADGALYASKLAGRNMISIAPDGGPEPDGNAYGRQ